MLVDLGREEDDVGVDDEVEEEDYDVVELDFIAVVGLERGVEMEDEEDVPKKHEIGRASCRERV